MHAYRLRMLAALHVLVASLAVAVGDSSGPHHESAKLIPTHSTITSRAEDCRIEPRTRSRVDKCRTWQHPNGLAGQSCGRLRWSSERHGKNFPVACAKSTTSSVQLPVRSLPEAMSLANSCSTTQDALRVIQSFLENNNVDTETQNKALAEIEIWEARDRAGAVNCCGTWLNQDQVLENKLTREKHIDAALAFLSLDQDRLADMELAKASGVDPCSGRAELMLGIIDCMTRGDQQAASKHFQDACAREPSNSFYANNVAVTAFLCGQTTHVARDLKLALNPDTPLVAKIAFQNLSSILKVGRVNSRHLGQLRELYKSVSQELEHPSDLGPACKLILILPSDVNLPPDDNWELEKTFTYATVTLEKLGD
jgi:Flp pilus assembly protein TadD